MKTFLRLFCLAFFIQFYCNAQEKWTCYTDEQLLLMDDYRTLGVFEYVDGSLWIITDRGINIFDGTHWKKLDNKKNPMNKSISSYMVDSKNRVWVGSNPEVIYGPAFLHKFNDGVVRYDGKQWQSMRTKDMGFKAPVVTRMFESKNGDIWLAVSSNASGAETSDIFAKGALLRLSNEEWTVYKAKDMPCLSCEFVKGFHEDENGKLYFFAQNGLFYFENGTFHEVQKDEGYKISNRVISVKYTDSKKHLWLAAPARAAMFNGGQWTTYNRKNGLPERTWIPLGFTETKDNDIVLSMSNGVYMLDGSGQWERLKKQFLSANAYIDSQNRIWAPTHKGLEIKDGNVWTIQKDIPKVFGILEDKDGGVWALSNKNGVKRLKDGQSQVFNKKNQLPSSKIMGGYVANDGKVWIATNKGICSCEY